jgi:hypothetical protein
MISSVWFNAHGLILEMSLYKLQLQLLHLYLNLRMF